MGMKRAEELVWATRPKKWVSRGMTHSRSDRRASVVAAAGAAGAEPRGSCPSGRAGAQWASQGSALVVRLLLRRGCLTRVPQMFLCNG